MFRLGFKKNEEKDILITTITELQELRAEISDLKDRIILITPDHSCIFQESSPEEMAEESEGEAECEGGALDPDQPESPEKILSEATASNPMTEDEDQGDQLKCIDPEIIIANENKAEEAVMLRDPGGSDPTLEELSGRENAVLNKEWAVVSFVEAKRPWWRLWGPKNQLVRRSI